MGSFCVLYFAWLSPRVMDSAEHLRQQLLVFELRKQRTTFRGIFLSLHIRCHRRAFFLFPVAGAGIDSLDFENFDRSLTSGQSAWVFSSKLGPSVLDLQTWWSGLEPVCLNASFPCLHS